MLKAKLPTTPDLVNGHPLIISGSALWRGSVTKGICDAYQTRAIWRLNFSTARRIEDDYEKIKAMIRNTDGIEGEIERQELYYKILTDNGLGTRSKMFEYAGNYIDSHLIPAVNELICTNLEKGAPVFLVTTEGTSAASYVINALCFMQSRDLRHAIATGDLGGMMIESAIIHSQSESKNFTLNGGVFNGEVFKGGNLIGINTTIKTDEDMFLKTVSMLDAQGIKLKDCAVVGNAESDSLLLTNAAIRFCSTSADKKIREVYGIRLLRG